jgi:2-succinyl-5-enolpyruvyl-6-hydroxy-3-cyclohexene-1-carboxylate synthase
LTEPSPAPHPNPSTALARVVMDEAASQGVKRVVIAPGSRSAALAIAAAQHPELDTIVVIDERSAAFHALGAARASDRPVAVVATSGTAPANFLPAVVEADMSCVPLVAISADRPAELRGVGANQTIDQVELFGNKVRGYAEIEAPTADVDSNRSWRRTVADLVARARGPRPGPVHLNVAFREPTVPVADDGRSSAAPYPFATPRLNDDGPTPGMQLTVDRPLDISGGRALVIAGDGAYDRASLMAEATRLGWPILATALSGLRGRGVVAAYRRILSHGVPPELAPDAALAIGAIGPDPRLEELITASSQRIRVDAWGRSIDPGRNATAMHPSDPVALMSEVGVAADASWTGAWREAEDEARSFLADVLTAESVLTGGAVAHALNRVPWKALVVASSLPIREVDAHLRRAGPVFANRGASGIDGFVSTCLGVASERPMTLGLAGDLSFLHDANGFLHDGEIELTLVVVDNGGGGLFDSLPQARHAPEYERLFVTDPRRNLADLARFHGARVETVDSADDLVRACSEGLSRAGLDLVVVRVDRSRDLAMRNQLFG